MQTRLRDVTGSDDQAIDRLIDSAFAPMVVAGLAGGEAKLVRALRSGGYAILETVVVDPGSNGVGNVVGNIVGHILFTRLKVQPDSLRVSALAPMAVAPGFQRRGVGSSLINDAIATLWAQGEDAVIVVGHEGYYPRFGFSAALAARWFHTPWNGPHAMAVERSAGLLASRSSTRWMVEYPPPFTSE
jgi:putative acetyltransferase